MRFFPWWWCCQGIIHRDMKADNLFLSDGDHLKVADFGLAALGIRTTGQAGALPYESPEQTQRLPYDARNDVWAMGESPSPLPCSCLLAEPQL